MSLSFLQKDVVVLLKKDGTRIADIRASVQRNKIFIDAGNLRIEPEDLILRTTSNGLEETYRVIDPCFSESIHGIPSKYEIEVQKLGIPEAKQAVQSITYNITGNNARINQNSFDNSKNVVKIDSIAQNNQGMTKDDFLQLLQTFKQNLSNSGLPEDMVEETTNDIEAVEKQLQKPEPNKSIVSRKMESINGLLEDTNKTIDTAAKGYETFNKLLVMGTQLLSGIGFLPPYG
jgi:hypothetical protein